MRTLNEKYEYNRKRNTDFAAGYCFGVSVYRDYPKRSAEVRKDTKRILAFAKTNAPGDNWSKGVMCGVRDAARERKARKK